MAKGDLENSARLALRQGSVLLTSAFFLSFAVNVLRLSGPLFMILIYDRVLTSRSEETLFALVIMVAVLVIVLGLLDYSRKRIIARFAAQFQERLEHTILGAARQADMFPNGKSKPAIGLDEADSLRTFFHSGGLLAVMDFIWTPMFVAVVFFLHPVLGYVCLGGITVIFLLAAIRAIFMGGREERAEASSREIADLKNMVVASREIVRSQDMSPGYKGRWVAAREGARDNAIALRDWTAWTDQLAATTLLLVRYGVLAVGAYFALKGQITVGAMVASMFLVTRVLVPVNQFAGEFRGITKAIAAWKRLKNILRDWDLAAEEPTPSGPANPRERLVLEGVSVRAPVGNAQLLKPLNLIVAPGTMVEILGASGSGKSVMAEAIVGVRRRNSGTVRCDGVHVARMTDVELEKAFGYVPETPRFIDATLAENISHLDPVATPDKIATAARKACMHAWISGLPQGYQTRIDPVGSVLSRGQRQQLAFARALYHDPKVLVIDEPDQMLLERLPQTIKKTFDGILKRGGVIVLLARKPLLVQQARLRYNLNKGALSKAKSIRAVGSDPIETNSGKVTVLSGKKPASGNKSAHGGSN